MELRLLALKQYKTYPPYITSVVALPWETRWSKISHNHPKSGIWKKCYVENTWAQILLNFQLKSLYSLLYLGLHHTLILYAIYLQLQNGISTRYENYWKCVGK